MHDRRQCILKVPQGRCTLKKLSARTLDALGAFTESSRRDLSTGATPTCSFTHLRPDRGRTTQLQAKERWNERRTHSLAQRSSGTQGASLPTFWPRVWGAPCCTFRWWSSCHPAVSNTIKRETKNSDTILFILKILHVIAYCIWKIYIDLYKSWWGPFPFEIYWNLFLDSRRYEHDQFRPDTVFLCSWI